jgi:glycerol-3-phosphate acyltransferase PlsY
MALAAAAGAMIGHVAPVWLWFRGGKGVATALGILLAAAWPIGAAACLLWLLAAALFRFSSLAALIAVAAAPILALIFDRLAVADFGSVIVYSQVAALGVLIAAIVWARHAANISRLLTGREPRIGQRERTPGVIA